MPTEPVNSAVLQDLLERYANIKSKHLEIIKRIDELLEEKKHMKKQPKKVKKPKKIKKY